MLVYQRVSTPDVFPHGFPWITWAYQWKWSNFHGDWRFCSKSQAHHPTRATVFQLICSSFFRQVPTYPSGQIGAFMARKGGGTGTLAVEGGTPRCHGGAKWLRFGDWKIKGFLTNVGGNLKLCWIFSENCQMNIYIYIYIHTYIYHTPLVWIWWPCPYIPYSTHIDAI